MDSAQIKLVQDSFGKVAPIADQAASIFYDRLFEVAPNVRPMFPSDMSEQRKKLMAALALVVRGLSHLETILPNVSALAKRHVAYGVKREHYPVVGGASCGPWKRDLATAGRQMSRPLGRQPMASSPTT